MATATTTSEKLLRDVHPAEVLWPAFSERPVPARAVVTTHRVEVYVELEGRTALWQSSTLQGDRPQANRGSLFGQLHLETDDGPVHVSKGKGCGCHSPLRLIEPPYHW